MPYVSAEHYIYLLKSNRNVLNECVVKGIRVLAINYL